MASVPVACAELNDQEQEAIVTAYLGLESDAISSRKSFPSILHSKSDVFGSQARKRGCIANIEMHWLIRLFPLCQPARTYAVAPNYLGQPIAEAGLNWTQFAAAMHMVFLIRGMVELGDGGPCSRVTRGLGGS